MIKYLWVREMIVYIDILFILNCYITLLLIVTTYKYRAIRRKKINIIAGSLIGGGLSVAFFFLEVSVLFSYAIKIVFTAVIVAVAFGFRDRREFFKNCAVFLVLNLLLVGVFIGTVLFFDTSGIHINNSFLYISVSPVIMLITTALTYFGFSLFEFLTKPDNEGGRIYNLTFKIGGRTIKARALYDTGNSLCDPFSGVGVVLISDKLLLRSEIEERKRRIIPAASPLGDEIMYGVLCSEVDIEYRGAKKTTEAVLVPTKLENIAFESVLNPKILGR